MTHAAIALVLLSACDDLAGFSGTPPPLATLTVTATGVAEGDLRVALVWGAQWLPEPLCILPPRTPELAAVVEAGCRDVLGFTPVRAGASVPIRPGEPATLPLGQLPSADVMVGGLTARVAYASLVVFDDVDGDGELTLDLPRLLPAGEHSGGGGPDGDGDLEERDPSMDRILGASFASMTQPDRRVAFREGEFVETGFYPRRNCGAPQRGYSVLSAGGFTTEAAIAATLAGELPAQDPATCAEDAPEDTAIEIELRPPRDLAEVGCEQRRLDSSVRYRDPPATAAVLDGRRSTCTSIPALGDADPTAGITQLVVASGDQDTCKALAHYTLVGCDDGRLVCDYYEWDLRASPPAWWPCE